MQVQVKRGHGATLINGAVENFMLEVELDGLI
jgi:hypothetical protein